jgi:HK97 family phage portal protein
LGILDLFRTRDAGTEKVRAEPPVRADASNVQSESQWSNGFFTGAAPSLSGVNVSEKTALSIPATLQALRILTGVYAMTPLPYYRRGENGRERQDDLAEAVLFRSAPNSHQTPFAFMELQMGDIMLAGDFYAYISRDASGRPVALTRLKPGSVVIAEYFDRAEGTILFYDATLPDGSHERFPARDILHIPGFGRNGLHGLNPIRYARDALGATIATSRHASRFWSKGGRPSTVLSTSQKVSAEDKGRIRTDWERLHSGGDGSQVAVIDQDLTASFLSHNMKDSQFLETREFQVVDLARIWGVPPHLIFDLSRATFSNIEQQSLEFVIYHLGPHYARAAQAITKAFARPGHYYEHMTEALVKGDLKSRMEGYWMMRQMGGINGNELRAKENMPDIPGSAGQEFWRPENMAIAGQQPQESTDEE